jgi:CheY-like chemotaxis protein
MSVRPLALVRTLALRLRTGLVTPGTRRWIGFADERANSIDSPATRVTPKERRMRVLVVDDESDVTLVVGEALRDRGHHVECASSGHEAIAIATAFHPDAVLVDIGLPDMDGVTLAEILRGSVAGKRLRVVAFSGYGDPTLRGAIQRDLFDQYLQKPASLQSIEDALLFPAAAPPRAYG